MDKEGCFVIRCANESMAYGTGIVEIFNSRFNTQMYTVMSIEITPNESRGETKKESEYQYVFD